MKIRYAATDDIEPILVMGAVMHEESRFGNYAFNREKAREMVEYMLSRQPDSECIIVAEGSHGQIKGFLAGYITEFFFSDRKLVQDRFFYVHPQHRGGPAALKLMIAFRRWAESKQADELNINMSVGINMKRFNKFMTHLGFGCCGANFALPLKPGAPAETTKQ